jgi:hypothetical protein
MDILASSQGIQVLSKFQIDQDEMETRNKLLESDDENITRGWNLEVGKLLYKSLFTEEINTLYDKSLEMAKMEDKGIRVL